jgi:hypothetical protein
VWDKTRGILSPDFYSVYIDDLIVELSKAGIGCYLLTIFIACILFADDLILLAPTCGALQEMLNICSVYCDKFCLMFNVRKSKVMVFGKIVKKKINMSSVYIGDSQIKYADSIWYLGWHVHFL